MTHGSAPKLQKGLHGIWNPHAWASGSSSSHLLSQMPHPFGIWGEDAKEWDSLLCRAIETPGTDAEQAAITISVASTATAVTTTTTTSEPHGVQNVATSYAVMFVPVLAAELR
eukprot:1129788-Amphidinium_carterae.1